MGKSARRTGGQTGGRTGGQEGGRVAARHKQYTHPYTGIAYSYITAREGGVSNLGLVGGGRSAVPEQAVCPVGGGGIPDGLVKVD